MIYYLPLEHLDARYTALMDTQLLREFEKQNKEVVKIDGDILTTEITTGAFLDANGTNYYKFSQLQKICKLFKEGKIKDGDVFFVSDLWFPGLEAIKYMAHFSHITVKIKGMFHAGSWTETDFVRGIEDWAQWIEKGWFKMIDDVFLGSQFIKQELIEKGRIIDFLKLHVTGLPFSTEDLYQRVPKKDWKDKTNVVVFTGRLDDEKQPWQFDKVEELFRRKYPEISIQFIKTMSEKRTKDEYLELLSSSKVVFSSALQENFGYGVLEGATYDCALVLPNRLAYKEFYPAECLYNTLEQAVDMIYRAIISKEDPLTLLSILHHNNNTERIVSLV